MMELLALAAFCVTLAPQPEEPKSKIERIRATLPEQLLQARPGIERELATLDLSAVLRLLGDLEQLLAGVDWWAGAQAAALGAALDEGARGLMEAPTQDKLTIVGMADRETAAKRPVVSNEILQALIDDRDETVRFAAAVALMMRGSEEERIFVEPALKNPARRMTALRALVQGRAKESAPAIVPLLKADDPAVRGSAAEALFALGYPDAVKETTPLLNDPDRGVRVLAVRRLARAKERSALARGIEMLRTDSDPEISAGIDAVLAFGAVEAAQDLVEIFRKPAPPRDSGPRHSVWHQAAQALVKLRPRRIGKSLAPILAEVRSGHAAMYAEYVLRKVGTEEDAEDLVRIAQAGDLHGVRSALRTLRTLRSGTAEFWEGMLKESGKSLRSTALAGLASTNDPKAAEALLRLLQQASGELEREAALVALARRRHVASVPLFFEPRGGRSEPKRPRLEYLSFYEQPELSQKLESIELLRLDEDLSRKLAPEEVLKRLEKQLGLPVKFEPEIKEAWWSSPMRAMRPLVDSYDLAKMIWHVHGERCDDLNDWPKWYMEAPDVTIDAMTFLRAAHNHGSRVALIGKDAIRLVPEDVALRHWQQWWEKHPERPKAEPKSK